MSHAATVRFPQIELALENWFEPHSGRRDGPFAP